MIEFLIFGKENKYVYMSNIVNRPTLFNRSIANFNSLLKRSRQIGFLSTLREFYVYINRYNRILKNNNSFSSKFALYNASFYFHVVGAFPEISRRDVLNYVPYTLTYAVYIRNKIDRSKFTFDKLDFYRKAIENGISIPITYGFTDSEGKFSILMSNQVDFDKNIKDNNIIAKPRMANSGTGIIEYSDKISLNNYIFQEKVKDHTEINKLTGSPHCSTVRVALYNKGGDLQIMAAHIRLNAGKIIDHLFSGSVYADVDINRGTVSSFGLDSFSNRYLQHPLTGVKLIGFQIPYWNLILEEAEKVCKTYTELPLIGLDVVVTKDGPVTLEINGGFHTFGLQFNKRLFGHPAFSDNLKI